MDRDVTADLKAQAHAALANLKHRDFEHSLVAGGRISNDHRFAALSR
jgi:hypothetical protein